VRVYAAGMLEVTRRHLLAHTARAQAEGRLPSLVAGVVHDGELAWWGGRGGSGDAGPTADTQYRIGSITKTFTAVQVMRLRDAGRLSLDTRVDELVPGTPAGDRTVGQLLAHASGLQAETSGPWWERSKGREWDELMGGVGPEALVYPAGRRFHYSNLGYGILGEIVARQREMPWAECLRRDVLDPLDMRRTSTDAQPPAASGLAVHPWAPVVMPEPAEDYRAMAPAGQLWSTVADLGRWARFLLGDTGDVLSPDTVAEMAEEAVLDSLDAPAAGYGLGLSVQDVDGRRLVGHGGSVPGFLAVLLVDRQERTGVVTLTNATTGLPLDLTTDLLRTLRELEPHVADPWTPSPLPEGLTLDMLGTWHWGTASFGLRAEAGGTLTLEALRASGRATRFRPAGEGRWVGLNGYWAGEVLTPGRDAAGRVTHLDVASFCFTRTPYDPQAPVPGDVDPAGWR
jgi:CubicO group peptidase (beta-lactamase class C family)